jgi:hypothetical protein
MSEPLADWQIWPTPNADVVAEASHRLCRPTRPTIRTRP